MEDSGRIVRRKNASNLNSKYSAPTRHRPDIHNVRMATKILDSICFENKRFSSMERDPHNPVEYNDVFGGPPRCFSSRKIAEEPPFPRRSCDGLYRTLGKELNSNRSFCSLPVFELPVYENSSLPVFELPVFGGSEFPVFEFPSSRDDLGSRVTSHKSSSDEFYADIFRGGDGHPNSVYEESTSKSLSSKPSRSRSKSSSSQPSSENPSPHQYASSRMSGDLSLSALASKLRPIALSKRDRPFVFGSSGTQHTGYQSQGSDNVSVCSSSSCSPSQFFSDSASFPSVHLNKPRTLSNRTGRRNVDDVFGGFPKRRPFPQMQTCQKTEEFKTGPTLGRLDRTNVFEKYPVLLHDSSKNSLQWVNAIGCIADDDLATKPIKEVPFPVATVHHMTQNTFDSSPSEHFSAPQKVKSWRDWVPEVKYAQLGSKKDSSTCSSMCMSHVSPVTEASYWAQEEPAEINLETPGRNSLDGGDSYDIPGSYGINSVFDRRKNMMFHNKIDNHLDDISDIAIKEAIAWAKEKFQGNLNEGKGDASMFVQEPNDKDEAQVGDGNINGLRQCGHDAYTNGEERKQKAVNRCLHQRTLERTEDHGNRSIDQSDHSSESDDQLFICKNEIDRHPQETKINRSIDQSEHSSESDDRLSICKQEIERHPQETKKCPLAPHQCTLTDLKERLIKEVTNDVTGDYNPQTANQDDAETLLHTPELQDAHAVDTLSSGGANQMSCSRLVDECTCYELERWNGHAHAVDCRMSQYERSCTLAVSLETATVKEIPEG
ncbi:hypothetical protein SUGI_1118810 [Cryptomeria japonica]|uniref:uncharacterized protein LOC131051351 n=1 Tax=Cryptomeria japonica TaxID=3369 RepID=UPI00241493BE|nr:uncharacterized protein LOC131051351 [Cryptomeria japonica]XP_057841808.2 uncharacterized protein LOC131051351 [Cryptomeria japonica]XP_057841809.2 uncharacterized protein LOC131051351 [Cryptomeria japonica]GLJ52571.1 hypothetical protein SUGI_1118810 [Cryptomeria japonica]